MGEEIIAAVIGAVVGALATGLFDAWRFKKKHVQDEKLRNKEIYLDYLMSVRLSMEAREAQLKLQDKLDAFNRSDQPPSAARLARLTKEHDSLAKQAAEQHQTLVARNAQLVAVAEGPMIERIAALHEALTTYEQTPSDETYQRLRDAEGAYILGVRDATK